MVWTSTKTTPATAACFDTRTGLINPPHSVLPRIPTAASQESTILRETPSSCGNQPARTLPITEPIIHASPCPTSQSRQTKARSTSIRQPHAPDLDPLEAETAHRPEPYTPFCHLEAKRAVRRLHGLAVSGFGLVVILAAALGQCSVVTTAKSAATGTGDPELRHRKEIPSEAVSYSRTSACRFQAARQWSTTKDHCVPRVEGPFGQR
jgi:hypothetical protein